MMSRGLNEPPKNISWLIISVFQNNKLFNLICHNDLNITKNKSQNEVI